MKECHLHKKEPCTSTVSIFQALSHEEKVKIASMIVHKHFQKGEVLLQEGNTSDTLFIIYHGQIKLSKLTPQGKEQILHILKSGDFFGELHLFHSNEESNFSAYAIEDTEVCILTKEKMTQLMLENPSIMLRLLETITKRLFHIENAVQNLATKNPEIRIVHMILEFCETYGQDMTKGIVINLPLNREEMANYIGITRETLSRKLHTLESQGLIEIIGNKQLIVKNKEKLKKFAGK